MSTSLLQVRGAQLVEGRLVFGDTAGHRGAVGLFTRPWRRVGPRPVEVFPGERFVMATRLHWCIPLKGMAHSGVAWPVAMSMSWLLDGLASGLWVFKVVVWVGAVAHQLMMCHRVLAWRAHLMVVTSKRLLQVSGVFDAGGEDILLSEIRKVTVLQKWWQRVLGFGTLRIEIAGDHDVGARREFKRFVPDPWVVYRAIRQPVVGS